MLARRVADLERAHRLRREQDGVSVLGRRRLMKVRWTDTPRKRERWFGLRPQVAEPDRELRVAALRELKQFRKAYRVAYAMYRAGDHGVVFPYGTWEMRVRLGARTAPPP